MLPLYKAFFIFAEVTCQSLSHVKFPWLAVSLSHYSPVRDFAFLSSSLFSSSVGSWWWYLKASEITYRLLSVQFTPAQPSPACADHRKVQAAYSCSLSNLRLHSVLNMCGCGWTAMCVSVYLQCMCACSQVTLCRDGKLNIQIWEFL